MKNLKLCYVNGPWAFFTTQELKYQWGDDWDDAPYEHNAGTPYTYGDHDAKDGRQPWEILKIAVEGPLNTPSDFASGGNSPYSVNDINAGAVAWLATDKWAKEKVVIPAGCDVETFKALVKKAGGKVYVEGD